MKGAFPDIEEAELAESGVEVGPDFEEEDFERAPDELQPERDLASASSQRRDAERMEREDAETHARRVGRGKLLSFFGHVIDELRRVQWPDRRQVGQGTLVVLLFVLVAGAYLGLLDAIWNPIVQAIL
jgi:preprotein translocase SecE subunit